MGIFSELFTWWNGNTIGTRWFTFRRGEFVGEDDKGNKYYQETKNGPLGYKRRWVTYNGISEASEIPAEWHGWMHYTVDIPPTEEEYENRHWQKQHIANRTGTPNAYRPAGSALNPDRKRPKTTGDYEAWRPE